MSHLPGQEIINYSWDLIVICILIITLMYVFGHMVIDTGLPQYYVERYFLTLVAAIIGYQGLFSVLFYMGFRKTIYMFGFPVIDLSSMKSSLFIEKLEITTSSSAFIFFFLLLSSIPLLAVYHKFFKEKTEFRYNKILIKQFFTTLICILFLSLILLFTSLSV